MLREKRINYAIGFAFGCLLLGIMAVPFLGEATCYELIDVLSIVKTLGENDPKVTAACTFVIINITVICLMLALAVTGFVLKCTKYKSSKAENVISWIYSSFIFVVIASTLTLLVLLIVWSISADADFRIGMLITLVLNLLLPYFCATKMNLAFCVYSVVMTSFFGVPIFILHIMVFSKRYKKNNI
ncbi:MAG: hypothetical protein K2K60_07185 [Clostridia bacterium]|nr:hypothetical protein [Clostridia bacterium]